MDVKNLTSHGVVIRDRRQIEISGVEAVESFDDEMISLIISEGKLTIEGSGLRIGELSVGNQNVTAEGEIYAVQYHLKAEKVKSGIFRRRGAYGSRGKNSC